MRACDNKVSPFEGVWSWVVGERKCLAGWAIDHSPQGRPWPELRVWPSVSAPRAHTHIRTHTSIASVVYGHRWRTSNEWNIIFHIIFQFLTLLPSHKSIFLTVHILQNCLYSKMRTLPSWQHLPQVKCFFMRCCMELPPLLIYCISSGCMYGIYTVLSDMLHPWKHIAFIWILDNITSGSSHNTIAKIPPIRPE